MTSLRHLALVVALGACAGAQTTAPLPERIAPAPPAAELISDPPEYQDRPISIEAGEEYFARSGIGDPYGAGIAYPVFLAFMRAYATELGGDWRSFSARFGMIATKDDSPPLGFHLTTDPITRVKFVMMNCQVCHADVLRLPGGAQIVSGIGSKRVRIHAYDAALTRIAEDPTLTLERLTDLASRAAEANELTWPREMRRPIVEATLKEMRRRAAIRSKDVRALEHAMPGRVATIESFMMALNAFAGAHLALPARHGWTKIPDVRAFPYRETLSYDAVGSGAPSVLVAEADFAAGARPIWYESHRHIGTSLHMFLRSFDRRLTYPREVDRALSAEGRLLFNTKCAPCHGTYTSETGERRVSYKERVIPIEVVNTDRTRLDAVTPEFIDAANAVPAARGVTRVRATGGYVPPVLVDVWARGLYGHAGQWPDLAVLATPPSERPRRFVIQTEAPYDLDRIGSRWRREPAASPSLGPGEYVYDASEPGYDVAGHPFLSDLPANDRRAILEYLKTI